MSESPFISLAKDKIVAENAHCRAFYDGFPVSEGHVLVVPIRVVPSFQDMTQEEWTAAHELIQEVCAVLRRKDPTISGFNIGINDGASAGQTVFHAHIHVIPRRDGDHPNPRGGVRGVFPDKQNYP